MGWLELIVAVFAVYRVATDLAWEGGPGGLFERWRGWVMRWAGADSWIAEGIGCPICLSFWLALPLAFLWGVLPWLAIAGAAAFLARVSDG